MGAMEHVRRLGGRGRPMLRWYRPCGRKRILQLRDERARLKQAMAEAERREAQAYATAMNYECGTYVGP